MVVISTNPKTRNKGENPMSDIKGNYIATEHFAVMDTIGVPHPYVIGPKHVEIASDRFGGQLTSEAIIAAEKGVVCRIDDGRRVTVTAKCAMRGCNLSFEEHKQALLIACKAPLKDDDGNGNPELEEMLKANVDEAMANNYEGFAFLDKRHEAEA